MDLDLFYTIKRGNLEEDDVQMPLKLVKELLKQQESTLKVFPSAYMDSVNTRIDNLLKDVQSVISSLEFIQAQGSDRMQPKYLNTLYLYFPLNTYT